MILQVEVCYLTKWESDRKNIE